MDTDPDPYFYFGSDPDPDPYKSDPDPKHQNDRYEKKVLFAGKDEKRLTFKKST